MDAVTLCTPFLLIDDPSSLSDRCALVYDSSSGTYHLAQGDVICIRSRPNALRICHTAALINGVGQVRTYALPPNSQLSLEAVREPPWITTFRRLYRYEEADGIPRFVDRRDTLYDAKVNRH